MNGYQNIDEYKSNFPPEVQKLLEKMRQTIHEAVPAAEETISYGIPTFKYKGKNLAHFGGFKKHIGFYPTPEGIGTFARDLAEYSGAKGSVQFPFDKPTPYEVITKIVKFRAQKIDQN